MPIAISSISYPCLQLRGKGVKAVRTRAKIDFSLQICLILSKVSQEGSKASSNLKQLLSFRNQENRLRLCSLTSLLLSFLLLHYMRKKLARASQLSGIRWAIFYICSSKRQYKCLQSPTSRSQQLLRKVRFKLEIFYLLGKFQPQNRCFPSSI